MAALPIRSIAAPPARAIARPASASRHAPHLSVVPARRRTAGLVLVASVILAALMLGAAVLNTTLAERQLKVDELDVQVGEANDRFEVLRGQRAELRSPGRLSDDAKALGMSPAASGAFVVVDPHTYAEIIAAFGSVDEADRIVATEQPLDQFRRVKQAAAGEP